MWGEEEWGKLREGGANVLVSTRSSTIVWQLEDADFERAHADLSGGRSAAATVGQLRGGYFQ
jgi:hypothetical protein